MKDEHIDIDKMVMESHYLHALDIEDSQSESSLSDMERQDYIDMIKSEREAKEQFREMVSSLQETIRSLNQKIARHDEQDAAKDQQIAELKAQIIDLNKKIGTLTISLTSVTERLNIMLDEKYNKKTKSNRHDNNKP